MFLNILIIYWLLKPAFAQQLISPCPKVFQYEQNPSEPDRWYGTVKLKPDSELTGIWFRLLLNKESIQLGNWFGEVETRDNNLGYLIKNPNTKYPAGKEITLKFYVRYNPNEAPPMIVQLRLNAKQICPDQEITTPAPPAGGQLFTNKPIASVPDVANLPTDTSSFTFQKPSNNLPPVTTDDDDFYHGDFSFALNEEVNESLLNNVACGSVVKQPRPLVTHGQATLEGEFPWHAAIYHSKGIDLTYTCGGSLISSIHLITVAHCVTTRIKNVPLRPNNLIVYLGKFYLSAWSNPGLQDRRVAKVIVHPKYNSQSFTNDIAILKMAKQAQFTDYVRPVCLWDGPNELQRVVNSIGLVAGWGFDAQGHITEQLTKAHMPIVSLETCIYSLPEFYSRFTSTSTFCAGFRNGTSVCNGDSGGGLVLQKPGSSSNNPIWQLRGLVSVSVALQNRLRCDSSRFVVFTDVAKYLDFIKLAMTN